MAGTNSENPRVFAYSGAVGLLVFSLLMTWFGRTNNAWIVLSRPSEMDQFRRGVGGRDCYESYDPQDTRLTCFPWHYLSDPSQLKSFFATKPFYARHASNSIYVAYYIAIFIMISQVVSLAYTIGHCLHICESAQKFKFFMVHTVCIAVGLWIVLFGIYVYETFSFNICPEYLMRPGWSYEIGNGCWTFFLGGMLPYIGAICCLYANEIRDKLREISPNQRLPVPTNNQV